MPNSTPVGSLGAATPGTSRTAQTELAAWPSGTKVGDLAVVLATAEAGVIPDVVAASTPETLAATAQGTSFARRLVVLRITQADLAAGGLRASVEAANVTRRMSVRGFVVRDAAVDAHAHGAAITGGTVPSATTPSVTPTVDDALLVAFGALATTVDPFQRDYAVSGTGWTGRGESESASTTAVNAVSVVATRQLTGGAGSSQTGATLTASADNVRGFLSTVALRYQLAPPIVEAGADRTIDPFEVLTLTATSDRGSIAWAKATGPDVVLTGSGASVALTGPATVAGTTVVLRATATDGSSTGFDDVTVTVRPHNEWEGPPATRRPLRFWPATPAAPAATYDATYGDLTY